ncbi:MAG: tyrosine-type recombinase/integrase [Oscillospiraceae bacterium]|nr:tyrosine-type recombinase/integrase [Oscillospiraceae bacterium]
MAATSPIRSKQQVRALAEYYIKRKQPRNHVLIVLGVHTALRVSDLLRLTWEDVYDTKRSRVRKSVSIAESKTGKRKTFTLNSRVVTALKHLYNSVKPEPGGFLFENPRTGRAIGRVQAFRIIRDASESLDLGRVSCHSLRKTFGYHAWKSGVSPAVIMEIYNHSSFDITRRYLGVTQDDKDDVYRKMAKLI